MAELSFYELTLNQAQQQLVLLTTKARADKYANGCVCDKTLRCLTSLYAIIQTLSLRGATLTYHEVGELANELKSLCGHDTLPYRAISDVYAGMEQYSTCDCTPAPHQHPVSDIVGLEDRLTELENRETTVTGETEIELWSELVDYPANYPKLLLFYMGGVYYSFKRSGAYPLPPDTYNTDEYIYPTSPNGHEYYHTVGRQTVQDFPLDGNGWFPRMSLVREGSLVVLQISQTAYSGVTSLQDHVANNPDDYVVLSGTAPGPSGISQEALDAAIETLRPNGFATFAATNTFDKNKVMKLEGAAFNQNFVLQEAAEGNKFDTYLTVYVTGNGTNTISFGAGWKGSGAFDSTSGVVNEIVMRYLDDTTKTFIITQPA